TGVGKASSNLLIKEPADGAVAPPVPANLPLEVEISALSVFIILALIGPDAGNPII
ncbi:unnamed protein product, partial [marine sediment metagenome]